MTECQGRHVGISAELAPWEVGANREVRLIRRETLRDVGQVRMISIAAYDESDEAFMVRILDPTVVAGAAGVARYRPEFDAVVW